MTTYANKSNAKRAAIKAIVKDRGVSEAEVKVNADKYFTIEGDNENGFYPHVLTEKVGGVSEEREAELKQAREEEKEEPVIGEFTRCPHCNTHLHNGVQTFDGMLEHAQQQNDMTLAITHEYLCLGCGEQFGEERELPVKGTGLKIEKDRPEQNGVCRPSAGGKCRAIWDHCDEMYAKGVTPMPKLIKEAAKQKGWNENNAVIEMYQWRKFHGVTGRQK